MKMNLLRLMMISCALCVATITINAQQRRGAASRGGVKRTTAVVKKPASVVCNAKAVDLGLPSGTLWADRNVGADTPQAYGGLYRYGNRGKGSGEGTPKQENIIGTQYDVAKSKMGAQWQLPSYAQLEELFENCIFEYQVVSNVKGYTVTGPNGNTIFLPLTGCMYNYGRSQAGTFAFYASGQRAGYEMYNSGEIYCLSLWEPRDGFDNKLTIEGTGMGNPVRAVRVAAQ